MENIFCLLIPLTQCLFLSPSPSSYPRPSRCGFRTEELEILARTQGRKRHFPWFQNPFMGRAAPVPRPSQGGLCAPNCPCQQCLLAAQRNAGLFSTKPGMLLDQAGFGGYVGNLSVNMASHNLPSAADEPSETCAALSPSFSLHHFSSGFNPEDLTAPNSPLRTWKLAVQRLMGAPNSSWLMGMRPYRDTSNVPPSGEQQPWWGSSQPSPEMKPEMEFEQSSSQSLETAVPPWSCWSLPQPPLPQELCSHPASSEPFPKKAAANIRRLYHPYL